MTTTTLEPETQTAQITLSPERRLYRAFEEFVDPETFDGFCNCLIHQTVETLEPGKGHSIGNCALLADRFGVPVGKVWSVYGLTARCKQDLQEALAMARDVFGIE